MLSYRQGTILNMESAYSDDTQEFICSQKGGVSKFFYDEVFAIEYPEEMGE
jgi:hypothetical protein